ncbi:NADP-dependent 3-hydroxy acid dehydrogenase YdfG [Pedobacter cryoconitis]|uniref:NADP-dependent 3-hydroxy acid dehydrogenase YdfG n=1 Tax=Pedobacter cryoconitis TaxID=188932 RepID=A0A7W9E023_9SPHI|nr:SDR family oxidoreductase [Pedobacter cryoconitis]MBB5636834.1 NADP-dependent 3-hydroxy acid dehydrogenase YdfG [Pedobacter cryoconitis]
MNTNISGKVIVITGASSGIGYATAKKLSEQGAIVSLGARRIEKLEALVKEITAHGGQALARRTDVGQKEELAALVSDTVKAFGKVDVIVNNAGVMPLSLIEDLKFDEWDQMINVNIKGVLYGLAAVLPYFKEQKSGQVINVSSVAGHMVAPTSAIYSATKSAVLMISEGFRQEVKPYNIRTTIISPGLTESELSDTISVAAVKTSIEELRKMSISAESIANAIAYVISQPEDVDVSEMIIRPTTQPM